MLRKRWIYEDTLLVLNSIFRRLERNLRSQKNSSNVNVRKFATYNKERRSHLQRQLKCVLEKQNLVFQHISDLCCYLLKASGGIPYGIHK